RRTVERKHAWHGWKKQKVNGVLTGGVDNSELRERGRGRQARVNDVDLRGADVFDRHRRSVDQYLNVGELRRIWLCACQLSRGGKIRPVDCHEFAGRDIEGENRAAGRESAKDHRTGFGDSTQYGCRRQSEGGRNRDDAEANQSCEGG